MAAKGSELAGSIRIRALRCLVRVSTLRHFDKELTKPDTALYKYVIIGGTSSKTPKFSEDKYLDADLFRVWSLPVPKQGDPLFF